MAAATAATLTKTGGLLLRHVIPSSIRRRPPHYSSVIPQNMYSKTLKSGARKSLYCTISSNNNAIIEEPHANSNSNGNEEEGVVVSEEDKRKELGNVLDIRVGKIVKIWRHEEADTLYVEEVDVGEAEPRVICSGLVKYINIDHLLDKKVVVLANLKPRNMRGVKSSGMLMAASDASHENVELLVPPEGSLPGERVWFGSEDEKETLPDAASPNQIQKKKIWESVQPHLKTDASCAAKLGVHYMRTSTGVILSESLKNANIS